MTPQAAPVQPAPETLHVTLVLVLPVTVALNCWWAPATTLALVGEIVTATGGMMVTVAAADRLESAVEATLTVTWAGDGTEEGAVYRPVEVMVPQALALQPLPLTLHVTLLFEVPLTVAVNCWCWPVVSVMAVGEIVTPIGGTRVTTAVLDFVGSALEVTVTKTCAGLGTTKGAV